MDQQVKLPFEKSHAFIIGINDYEHLSRLKTAVNDAKGIAQRLEVQHAYKVHGPLLNPTKQALDTLFEKTIPQVVGPEDRVVFYFAGHGIALDGEEGPNGYLVPVDAVQGDKETLIPMDTLHQSLNDLPCKHGLLILDCCFSGAFKWSTGYRDIVFDLPKVIYEERFWRYVKDPAWQVITSSAYDQKAVDVISNQSIGMREEGEGMHSPFAKALFEAIEGAGDIIPADKSDGVITASELYAYLRDSVESQTQEQAKRQSPSMFNLARHDKGEFIFLNPRHPFNLDPTPDKNPFMGLASYNEADADFFFGRDRVTAKLLELVQNQPLTVVSGASGTGKSSVIKAGLLPILRKEGWELLPVIRPGKEPMKVLEEDLPNLDALLNPQQKLQWIDQQLEELLQGKSSAKAATGPDKKFLLIIDQYEELISQCLKEEDREAFEAQLARWLTEYTNLKIILSVRADFEPQFESEALKPWWEKGRYVVPVFSREEIREVITKPALQAVLFYEPLELVDRLQEDVSQAPGALPLLSFTLSELYYASLKKDRQRALTLEDYQEMGGVIGALRSKADQVYLNQDKAHQNSMKKLMLRLVSLEGGELAGKRVFVEELIFTDPEETQRIETVATQLVDARLIVRGKDQQGRTYIEPAHDALVRAWGRLWKWINDEGEEKLIWHNKLRQAVEDYHILRENDPQKARRLLWNSNPRLDILSREVETLDHHLNEQEERFVQASVNRKSIKRNQLIYSLVGVIALVASLGLWANSERKDAIVQRDKADSSLNVATFENTRNKSRVVADQASQLFENKADYTKAYTIAWNAYRIQANEYTSDELTSISKKPYRDLFVKDILPHGLTYGSWIKFSYDNRYFMVAHKDSLAVWQREPRKFLFKKNCKGLIGESGDKQGIGFSHHGEWVLAVDSENRHSQAWQIPTGDTINLDDWPLELLISLVYADDIKAVKDDYWVLAETDSLYGISLLSELKDAFKEPENRIGTYFKVYNSLMKYPLHMEDITNTAIISPDLAYVYAYEEKDDSDVISKFNIETGQKIAESTDLEYELHSLAYSSTNNYLSALEDGGRIYFWDVDLSELIDTTWIYYGDIISPDGRYAMEFNPKSNRKDLNIWELFPEAYLESVANLTYGKRKRETISQLVEMSPRQNYLVYNIYNGNWLKSLSSEQDPIHISDRSIFESINYTFSPDEKYLLETKIKSERGKYYLYEVNTGQALSFDLTNSTSVTFSADSKFLLSCEKDSTIYQWNLQDRKIRKPLYKLNDTYGRIKLSQTGNYLGMIGEHTQVMNLINGEIIQLKASYDEIEFSRDDSLILAKSELNVHILQSSTGNLIKNIPNAGRQPLSNYRGRLQMMTTDNNCFLLTNYGVFDMSTGFQVESFDAPKSTHLALDPQGRYQLRRYADESVRKRPIRTIEWLEGNIYKYPDTKL